MKRVENRAYRSEVKANGKEMVDVEEAVVNVVVNEVEVEIED